MTPPAESQAAALERLDALDATPRFALPEPALRLLSDERLARLVAAGDRKAFGVVFDRHHQALYRYCVSLVRDPEDAADALQSTMLRALAALQGETRTIALRPWLYRIAHNESISLLRRRPTAVEGPEPAGVWDVEASAEARARVQQLLLDLRDLPERQRGALVMRELAGLDYCDIAAALDTTPGAAKQAIYDARQALFELAKGREMDCERVRHKLSDGDRRVVRGRALRAHLRDCSGCRDFESVTSARRSALASLVPAMPAAAAGLVRGLVGGGGAGGVSAAGVFAGLSAPVAVSSIAAVVAAGAIGIGAGVIELQADDAAPARAPASAPAAPGPSAPQQHDSRARPGGPADRASAPASRRDGRASRSPRSRGGGGGATARGEHSASVRSGRPGSGGSGSQQAAPAPSAPQQAPAAAPPPAQTQSNPSPVPSVPQAVSETTTTVTTQVENVTSTVQGTVDQVTGSLPVRTPTLPRLP